MLPGTPQPSDHPTGSFYLTRKLRRIVKFGGRNVGAQGCLRKLSTNFLRLHHSVKTHSMDFNGEMTHDQDSAGQWRHVDGQDQSAQ